MPFSVAAYPGQTFSGKVARIAQAVDVKTRTMAVELDVANADGRLAPGTFCQVRWPVRRTGPSLFVPSGSVASTTGSHVRRARSATARTEWVDVKTGLPPDRSSKCSATSRPATKSPRAAPTKSGRHGRAGPEAKPATP